MTVCKSSIVKVSESSSTVVVSIASLASLSNSMASETPSVPETEDPNSDLRRLARDLFFLVVFFVVALLETLNVGIHAISSDLVGNRMKFVCDEMIDRMKTEFCPQAA